MMIDFYEEVLALSYFREKKSEYIISDLIEILGYNRNQIDELIWRLFTKEYLCYNDNMLSITNKGMTFLISQNSDEMSARDDYFLMVKISPESALPIEAPYVPERFTKKYDG